MEEQQKEEKQQISKQYIEGERVLCCHLLGNIFVDLHIVWISSDKSSLD